MAVNLVDVDGNPVVVLEGVVGAEDVDSLLELIGSQPEASYDLSACEHLHTAVVQLLLLAKVNIVALPEDTLWHHFFNSEQGSTDEDNFTG